VNLVLRALEAMDLPGNHASYDTYIGRGRISPGSVFLCPAGLVGHVVAKHSSRSKSGMPYARLQGRASLDRPLADVKLDEDAIRYNNPVIFIGGQYRAHSRRARSLEDKRFLIPFGVWARAAVRREGTDWTIVLLLQYGHKNVSPPLKPLENDGNPL